MRNRLAAAFSIAALCIFAFLPIAMAQNAPRNEAIIEGLDRLNAGEFSEGVALLRKGLETIESDTLRVAALGMILQAQFIMKDENAALGVFNEILTVLKESDDQAAKMSFKDSIIPGMTNYLISPAQRSILARFHMAMQDTGTARFSPYRHDAQTGTMTFTGSQTAFPETVAGWTRTAFKQLKPNAVDYLLIYEKPEGLDRIDVFVTKHDAKAGREAIELTVQVFNLKNMLIDSYGDITEQALATDHPLMALNAAYKVRQGQAEANSYITTVDIGQWLHKLRATTPLAYETGQTELQTFIQAFPWPSPGFQTLSEETTCKRKTSYNQAQPAAQFTDLSVITAMLQSSREDRFFEFDDKYMCQGAAVEFGETPFSHGVDKRRASKRGRVVQSWTSSDNDSAEFFLVRVGAVMLLAKDSTLSAKQIKQLSKKAMALMSRQTGRIDFLQLYADMPTQLQLRSRVAETMRGGDARATIVTKTSEAN